MSRPRLLLHACCGPCATVCVERLLPDYVVTLLWHNPNLYPPEEHERRLLAARQVAEHFGVGRIEIPPDRADWLQTISSVEGWESQSVVNKPYLANDASGRVYVTDPENYRVLVFDGDGKFLAAFGQYGIDVSSFNLPIGVAVDRQGNIFVSDSANARIMKFAPLDKE